MVDSQLVSGRDPGLHRDYIDMPEPAWIRFRPGPGGELTPEWAAYMLNQWWAARDKRLPFAEAVKAAAIHFMVGAQDG